MYNNPYFNNYSPQATRDRIDNQIAELEKIKSQLPQQTTSQPTNLTQNFQLASTGREGIRFANSIEEVQRDVIMIDTPYFSKDMSVVWVKNTSGNIKTYELKEIVPLDEKDMQIQYLQQQIEELKGKIDNEQYVTNDDAKFDETSSTENDGATRTTTKASKSTSVSRVSTSKKK